ncbi:hypothetical protein AVEN_126815-1 [Araneus ventricosus]|uniref:Uncharacterized protein n=1 Tax=Araneus ventricosus TaxID=182803 RepID=A0A4Y2L8E6_ARAVE|nr:hypothetical protein AVEN_126815-1 [Araneus ventricosus]
MHHSLKGKNVQKEKFLVPTCVHIQVRQENLGMIYLKTSFDGEFDAVDQNRMKRICARLEDGRRPRFPTHLLVKSAVPTFQQKYKDLLSLLPYVLVFAMHFIRICQKRC